MSAPTPVSLSRALALAALLAAPAWAAPIETAPLEGVPFQLSLGFPALPTLGAAPLTASAPVLAAPPSSAPLAAPLPAAAPQPAAAVTPRFAWGSMPPDVAQAFSAGDAREFCAACGRAEFTPPETDDAQQNLLREGAAMLEADRLAALLAAGPASAAAPAPARATKIDYAAFGRALAQRPGLGSGIFQSTAAKREILKSAGYTRLYGSGGARIPIDEAGDARIGRAFDATLRAYRRRLLH